MIPKILHFIWFGNNIPSYVYFSINTFKRINPDFSIHFIHKTINELECIS
jgi:mannosyltransferase OCH1-like enzyme